MKNAAVLLICVLFGLMTASCVETVELPAAPEGFEHIPLSSLEIDRATSASDRPQADRNISGRPMMLKGKYYKSGVGVTPVSVIAVKLNGSVSRFYTLLGIDDAARRHRAPKRGICDYRVYLQDEKGEQLLVDEGTISARDEEPVEIDIDYLDGWKYLVLETTDGADSTNFADYVDWANAYFVYREQNSTRPQVVAPEVLNSILMAARTVYSQPGVRFMHKMKVAEEGATITVKGLPKGLQWNNERNLVEGIVEQPGVYKYYAHITTASGVESEEELTLTVSDSLEMPLPFMGWLSWNAVESEVSEEIVKIVADMFESEGLVDYGWNTIMMDDWWHAKKRAADGRPQPDAERFPNGVKPVADYVHSKGMRFGLYTDAADSTCAGAFGSYGYETIDANQYAEWGVDIVKCDYCNAPDDVEAAKKRYRKMGDAFKASGRNITLYICEWGVREPWLWGAEAGGACWRISYDVRDCWEGKFSGVGVVQSINTMKELSLYQGVNRWNDADMLCTGLHGTGKSSNHLCKTGPGMTQDEYRTQFAMWCMWSSPMVLSFDPRKKLSDDDIAIITNGEMIALNQDRMGQQADLISEDDGFVVFAKDLENGDVALAVVNMEEEERDVTLDFAAVPALQTGVEYTCRDVQLQEAMADAQDSIRTSVRSHATQVFRLALKAQSEE